MKTLLFEAAIEAQKTLQRKPIIRHWLSALAVIAALGTSVTIDLPPARAVEVNEVNPRALEDLEALLVKAGEADTLFGQKKYAAAAQALQEANTLFVRASKRDANAERLTITLNPQEMPSLRYYGYGQGQNPDLRLSVSGQLVGACYEFNRALIEMWRDASVLGDTAEIPAGAGDGKPELIPLTQNEVDNVVRAVYGPPSRFDLPVGDNEWRNVLLWSRRAKLTLEHALTKYPAWKNESLNWGSRGQVTGEAALAKVSAHIKEAEPEVKRVEAAFKAAEPNGFSTILEVDLRDLNDATVGVNRDGYMKWDWLVSLYITKDWLTERRKNYTKTWAQDGKAMPPAKFKPPETKVAALKAAVEKNAPRWSFPPSNPHNAAIEAEAKRAVKALIPGGTIYKTALTTAGWSIVKDTTQLPEYRSRGVMVLVKKPGEKWAWLIIGSYSQDYTGGGTFNATGTFAPSIVRLQGIK